MRTTPRLLALSLALFTILYTYPAHAQDDTEARRRVSVMGEGVVRVVPDQAIVRFAISTRHDDPEEARRMNADTSAQALNAVRDLGVEERNIRLATLRLQPIREYDPETRRSEELGYEAYRLLIVELDSLDLLPALIAEIVQKGANRLEGIEYGLNDESAVRNEALQEAVRIAREKARLMTGALDAEVGPVLQINEMNVDIPRPMMRMEESYLMSAAKDTAAPEPDAYAAGEIEVRASVQVVFALQ